MSRFFSAALMAVVCLLTAFPQGYGTLKGSYFDPFPDGAAWTMTDALTGYTTTFTVAGVANQSWACFTPGAYSQMVTLSIAKTVTATYPNPGVAENTLDYVYKSGAWGPYIFIQQLIPPGAGSTPTSTTYFFNQYANPPYGMLLIASSPFWNSVQDSGGTNTCHTPPTTFPNTWTTVISQETRTTPVYAGPVNCSTYDSISTTQNLEKWCFAADPKQKFPPVLVELDTTIQGGNTVTIKLQTSTLTTFPRT